MATASWRDTGGSRPTSSGLFGPGLLPPSSRPFDLTEMSVSVTGLQLIKSKLADLISLQINSPGHERFVGECRWMG